MEQAEDTDVLSAPRIVTRDGQTATIEVGEERMVPKSFEAATQNTSVFIQHSDWATELMGVTLEVTPEIMNDNMIELALHPKVVDILGYDTYQVTPSDASMLLVAGQPHRTIGNQGRYPVVSEMASGVQTAVGNLYGGILDVVSGGNVTDVNDTKAMADWSGNSQAEGLIDAGYYDQYRPWAEDELIAVPEQSAFLPYFRVREIETLVTIEDGSTLGMGGLIYDKKEHYSDKVPIFGSIPLIGRLFRSEGERSIKRNLMIFVTATQVDLNGRKASELALKK